MPTHLRTDPLAALTRRELPWDDASVAQLDPSARETLAASWMGRASGERQTAESFRIIAAALEDSGAAPEIVGTARRATHDELRHAEICRRVASRYAGRELPAPALKPLRVPAHQGASAAVRRSLHIVGQCALNETTASAYLERCLENATAPLARAALRELLADEIDHARLGWAHLAAACRDASAREAIAPWIVPMLAANRDAWCDPRGYTDDPALDAHGSPPVGAIRGAVDAAIAELILPGFAHVGLDVGPAREWLAGVAGR